MMYIQKFLYLLLIPAIERILINRDFVVRALDLNSKQHNKDNHEYRSHC